MEYLSLHSVTNLTKIDFVKYMPNLIELDISGTSVVDLSILETQTNGGKLNKFASLGVSNKDSNLNEIQTTINNFWDRDGEYWTRLGDQERNGLKLYSEEIFEKLNMCDLIEKLKLSSNNVLLENKEYSLKGMTSLTEVVFWRINKQVELPGSVERISSRHSEFPKFENGSSLVYFDHQNSSETTDDGLESMFLSLNGCSTVKKIVLNWNYNMYSLDGFSNLKKCKIDRVVLNFVYETNGELDLSDFSNFKNGEGYVKDLQINSGILKILPDLSGLSLETLTVDGSNVENIDGLLNCTSIKTLNLSNNKIQNLDSLKNMTLLNNLNISNNNLYNTYNDEVNNKKINNLLILKNLYNNSLRTLNFSGNKFENCSELEELESLFGN